VRGFLSELVTRDEDVERDVIVDMEAGLEHLSRGTGRSLSCLVATIEPYYRSMETARRVRELARELGVAKVVGVANKLRDDSDRDAIREFCASHGLPLIGAIPYDASLPEAERAGTTPLDFRPDSPAVRAIARLSDALS
jgi:CO dehydrogenase maturation factor